MKIMNIPNTQASELGLVITRIFEAPRELVFKAWTEPERVSQWWGPRGFTSAVQELDVRPGGRITMQMHGPDGGVYPLNGIFQEIVPPERLVFATSTFEDESGNPQLEVLNIVTFTDLGGKTRLTLQARVVRSTPEVAGLLAGMEEGWVQAFDRLAETL